MIWFMRFKSKFLLNQFLLESVVLLCGRSVWNCEQFYVHKAAHFQANVAAVIHEVKGAPRQCQPQSVVLGNEFVEILVEKEDCRSNHSGVEHVHLAFRQMRDDELICDFRKQDAEGDHVQGWVGVVNSRL